MQSNFEGNIDTLRRLQLECPVAIVQTLFLGSTATDVESQLRASQQFMASVQPKIVTSLRDAIDKLFHVHIWAQQLEALVKTSQFFGLDAAELVEITACAQSLRELSKRVEENGEDLNTMPLSQVASAVSRASALGFGNARSPTWTVLVELAQAEGLCRHMKQLAGERNLDALIDSVEGHGDSLIREDTISALLKVTRLLGPLFLGKIKRRRELVESLEKAMAAERELAPCVRACAAHIEGLMRLFEALANRGELTKDVIMKALRQGQGHFNLLPSPEGSFGKETCELKFNNSTQAFGLSGLHDLRSRALLICNSSVADRDQGLDEAARARQADIAEQMRRFVEVVNMIDEILSFAQKLSALAPRFAETFARSFNASPQLQEDLLGFSRHLYHSLEEVSSAFDCARRTFFFLNFYRSSEAWQLLDLLEACSTSPNEVNIAQAREMLQRTGLVVHQMSRMEISAAMSSNAVSQQDSDSHEKRLFRLGHALQKLLGSRPCVPRALSAIKETSLDVVQEGQVVLAVVSEERLLINALLSHFCNERSLPTAHQVLVCDDNTDEEAVVLFLNRCFLGSTLLHALVGLERLNTSLQQTFLSHVTRLHDKQKAAGSMRAKLVVLTHAIQDVQQPILDFCSLSGRRYDCRGLSDAAVRDLLCERFPSAYCVTSHFAAAGKTQAVHERARLTKHRVKTLSLSGHFSVEWCVEALKRLNLGPQDALHIDIAPHKNSWRLNSALFEIVVLRVLSAQRSFVRLAPELPIFVELANIFENTLFAMLPLCMALTPLPAHGDLLVSHSLFSPVQVVCNYFRAHQSGELAERDLVFTRRQRAEPPKNSILATVLEPALCMRLLDEYFPTQDGSPRSHGTRSVFLKTLATQLLAFSQSPFFKTGNLRYTSRTPGQVRTQLFEALVDVAREFAERSVGHARRDQHRSLGSAVQQQLEQIRPFAESNHLIVAFQSLPGGTLSTLYLNPRVVPDPIRKLMALQGSGETIPDLTELSSRKLHDHLCRLVAPAVSPPPFDYALTAHSLVKMALMYLRIRAQVPVLIMGETGCGKTSLVTYLAKVAGVGLCVLNVHAGVSLEDIASFVGKCREQAAADPRVQLWVFLDEINTCDHLGFLCDVLCHGHLLGNPLPRNIVVLAACNPYRRRDVSAAQTAGLELTKSQRLEVSVKSGLKNDPMMHLVYRVHPLPETMIDYVWDYGALTANEEHLYIRSMVGKRDLAEFASVALSHSQLFLREHDPAASSSVSLRDVARCLQLFDWFKEHVYDLKSLRRSGVDPLVQAVTGLPSFNEVVRLPMALRVWFLALSHCYYSRLGHASLRRDYARLLAETGKSTRVVPHFDEMLFCHTVRIEQECYLRNMELPDGTALNGALLENVFVLLVCILNRIPVFLVGNPGCSKSLAMLLIRANLRGLDSHSDWFRKLPQAQIIAYQGSDSSTSDGILKIFDKARVYCRENRNIISTVLLDEVGLAEVSPHNPLKVLHSLLEPPTGEKPELAVVGISNWALDPAKMNRAIHLSRPEPDKDDLFETAKAIANDAGRSHTIDDSMLKHIAAAYLNYYESQSIRNFHGLRDFYSFLKALARSQQRDRRSHLQIIDRNFGGRREDLSKARSLFLKALGHSELSLQEEAMVHDADAHALALIEANLSDRLARHLMVISAGDMGLQLVLDQLRKSNKQPEVIYGSLFPNDTSDEYYYRVLNRIILCMEVGRTLILKNLGTVYGSLYDMLNQNYVVVGGKRNCRIALGAHSNPMCFVHDDFRCIVLLEESAVARADPPFLNRFEKQSVSYSQILGDRGTQLCHQLQHWLQTVVTVPSSTGPLTFAVSDALACHSDNLLDSLVIETLRSLQAREPEGEPRVRARAPAPAVTNEAVLEASKAKLVQLLSSDAVLRTRRAPDLPQQEQAQLEALYFQADRPQCVQHIVEERLRWASGGNGQKGNNCIVYTFDGMVDHILGPNEPQRLAVLCDKLSAFKSERELIDRLKTFFTHDEARVLVFQASAAVDAQVLPVTKYLIDKAAHDCGHHGKHVVLTVHLTRELQARAGHASAANGNAVRDEQSWKFDFLGGWDLMYADTMLAGLPLSRFMRFSLLEILDGEIPEAPRMSFDGVMEQVLTWCFTCIKYPPAVDVLARFNALRDDILRSERFKQCCSDIILRALRDQGETDWLTELACNPRTLLLSSTYVNAIAGHVRDYVRQPLAQLLFQLESSNLLATFFVLEGSADLPTEERVHLLELWAQQAVALSRRGNLPPATGLECFVLESTFARDALTLPGVSHIVKQCDGYCNATLALDWDDANEPDEITHRLQTEVDALRSSHRETPLAALFSSHLSQFYSHAYLHDYSILRAQSVDMPWQIVYALMERILGEHASVVGCENPVQADAAVVHVVCWYQREYIRSALSMLEHFHRALIYAHDIKTALDICMTVVRDPKPLLHAIGICVLPTLAVTQQLGLASWYALLVKLLSEPRAEGLCSRDFFEALRLCSDVVAAFTSSVPDLRPESAVSKRLVQSLDRLTNALLHNEYAVDAEDVLNAVLSASASAVKAASKGDEQAAKDRAGFLLTMNMQRFLDSARFEVSRGSIRLVLSCLSNNLVSKPAAILSQLLSATTTDHARVFLDLVYALADSKTGIVPAASAAEQMEGEPLLAELNKWLLQLPLAPYSVVDHPLAVLLSDTFEMADLVSVVDEPLDRLFEAAFAVYRGIYEAHLDVSDEQVAAMKAAYQHRVATAPDTQPPFQPLALVCAASVLRAVFHQCIGDGSAATVLPSMATLLQSPTNTANLARLSFVKALRAVYPDDMSACQAHCAALAAKAYPHARWLNELPWGDRTSLLERLGYSPFGREPRPPQWPMFLEAVEGKNVEAFRAFSEIAMLPNAAPAMSRALLQIVFEGVYLTYLLPQQELQAVHLQARALFQHLREPFVSTAHVLVSAMARNDFRTSEAAWLSLDPHPHSPRQTQFALVTVHWFIIQSTTAHLTPMTAFARDPVNARQSFVLAAPSNEVGEVMRALMAREGNVARYTCPNGHAYFIGECTQPMQLGICPTCRAQIGGQNHQNVPGVQKHGTIAQEHAQQGDTQGYLYEDFSQQADNHGVRQLGPTSMRIARVLLHFSVLFGNVVHSHMSGQHAYNWPAIWASLNLQPHMADNPSAFLRGAIQADWDAVTRLQQLTDTRLAMCLHSVCFLLGQPDAQLHTGLLTTTEARSQWEAHFDQKCIRPVFGDVSRSVAMLRECVTELAAEADRVATFQQEVDEVNTCDDGLPSYCRRRLARLLRARRPAVELTLECFQASFHAMPEVRELFPFVDKVFSALQTPLNAALARHLPALVRFMQLVKRKLARRLSRKDATSLSLADFVVQFCSESGHEAVESQAMLDKFIEAWNAVRVHVTRFECEQITMPELTPDQSVLFAALEKRDTGALLAAALDLLVNLHNAFIDDAVQLASANGVRALRMFVLGDGRCGIEEINVVQASSDHLISFDECNAIPTAYCCLDPRYGHGRELSIDWERVQMFFAAVTMPSAKRLCMELPSAFPFANEAFQENATLLEDLRVHFGQPLSEELKEQLKNDQQTSPEAALRFLEVVVVVVSLQMKARNPADLSRETVMDLARARFKPADFESVTRAALMRVPLGSLVTLYEEMEQQVCTRTIEMTSPCFREPLDPAMTEALRPLLQGSQPSLPSGELMTALNRYIFRFLSTDRLSSDTHKPLFQVLGCCWPNQSQLEEWNFVIEPLPEVILLAHAFELRRFLEKLRTEEAERQRAAQEGFFSAPAARPTSHPPGSAAVAKGKPARSRF